MGLKKSAAGKAAAKKQSPSVSGNPIGKTAPKALSSKSAPAANSAREQNALKGILNLLLNTFRVDFSHYRQTTVMRRLARRMGLCHKGSFEAYGRYLKTNKKEVDMLYDDLLLFFTEFFRDPKTFEMLKKSVFPNLVKGRSARKPIRVWVPGCSTGEEVYSLAIAIHEFLQKGKLNIPVQLFGTDLVPAHIEKARSGLYPEKISKRVSKTRLGSYFDKVQDGYKVTKHIREMCVFATQDITRDPPFPRIHLVSCRNVLIYFDSAMLEAAIPMFHFALKPGGFLLLGSSETMSKFSELFSPVDQKSNLYLKRTARGKRPFKIPVFEGNFKNRILPETLSSSGIGKAKAPCTGSVEQELLNRYAPPCVVVDAGGQIRQFRGHTVPYLEPASGEASLKLSRMAAEGLMPDISLALAEAKKTHKPVCKQNVSFKSGGKSSFVDIEVTPVNDSLLGELCFLITFQVPPLSTPVNGAESGNVKASAGRKRGLLQKELTKTKQHLQSMIEEKDEANQELWAANEEVQSTNEELQSLNEEMEAAKEELESSNEELLALNEELLTKNLKLITAEENYRMLFNEMLDGFALHEMIFDKKGKPVDYRFLSLNPAFERLTGLSAKALVGKTVRDVMPNIESHWIHTYGKVAITGKPYRFSNYARDLGKYYDVVAFRPKKGYFACIFTDVSDLKKSEEALKESEAILLEAQRMAHIGHWQLNCKTLEVKGSDELFRIFGLGKAQANLEAFAGVVHPEDREYDLSHIQRGMDTGQPWDIEHRLLLNHGEIKWVHALGRSLKADKGKPSVLIGTVHDITEQKKSREELEKTQRLESLGVLAGGIAHDFNNLLSGVFGYIDLALDIAGEGTSTARYLNQAMGAFDRAASLTQQLLTFSKGGSPSKEVVDIKYLMEESRSLALSGSNIKCEFKFKKDLRFVEADPNQMNQVMNNLLLNARQAMPEGGTVTVTAENKHLNAGKVSGLESGDYVHISIKDNGVGISPEVLPKVFDPFYSTKSTGSGLGLATSHSIITKHGGAITLQSRPGEGTTVHLYLAAAIGGGQPKPVIKVVEEPRGGRIMVMDDEKIVRDLGAGILELLGYECVCTKNGEEAIEVLKKERQQGRSFAAALLDLTIVGGMGGEEAVKHLLKLDPQLQAVVISGYSDSPILADPQAYGFAAKLAKPFKRVDLSKVLQDVLGPGFQGDRT